jgi:hypothetical protein
VVAEFKVGISEELLLERLDLPSSLLDLEGTSHDDTIERQRRGFEP